MPTTCSKKDLLDHYKDIRVFTNKLRNMSDYENSDILNTLHRQVVKIIEDTSSAKENRILQILKIVDSIACNMNISKHTHIGGNKLRTPYIQKSYWRYCKK